MKRKAFREKPAFSVMHVPFPLEVTCPYCGIEIDLWNHEQETACMVCGYLVFTHEKIIN